MNILAPKRILVVENDPSLCELLRVVLLSEGHQVEEAHDGGQALAKLDQKKFDVIFADSSIPEMQTDVDDSQPKVGSDPTPVVKIAGFSTAVGLEATSLFTINPFDLSSIREALSAI